MNTFSYIAFALGVGALTYYAFLKENKKTVSQAQPIIQVNTASMPQASGFFSSLAPSKKDYQLNKPEPAKKAAPLSGACTDCGKNVSLPFRCKYCGELFCGEHRLPEDHNCQDV